MAVAANRCGPDALLLQLAAGATVALTAAWPTVKE